MLRLFAASVLCWLALASCGGDIEQPTLGCATGRSTDTEAPQEYAQEDLQAPHSGYFVFFIDEHGRQITTRLNFDSSEVKDCLIPVERDMLANIGIIEVREESASFLALLELCFAETSCMYASEARIIGIVSVSFEECMMQCCGSNECSWGLMKYCVQKCTGDHGPKPDDPYSP